AFFHGPVSLVQRCRNGTGQVRGRGDCVRAEILARLFEDQFILRYWLYLCQSYRFGCVLGEHLMLVGIRLAFGHGFVIAFGSVVLLTLVCFSHRRLVRLYWICLDIFSWFRCFLTAFFMLVGFVCDCDYFLLLWLGHLFCCTR